MHKLKEVSFFDNKIEVMSSRLLKPIINNDLVSVNFKNNTRIDAFYRPGKCGSVESLQELMKLIDNQCHFEKFAPASSDFTIFVQEVSSMKEYHVHKYVLAAQSEVFANVFNSDSPLHKSGKMRIKEFSSTTVSAFLRFIYTGVIPIDVNAIELFTMATKYKVESLKLLAEEMVMRVLEGENAQEVFNLAHSFKCHDLKVIRTFIEIFLNPISDSTARRLRIHQKNVPRVHAGRQGHEQARRIEQTHRNQEDLRQNYTRSHPSILHCMNI